MTESRRGGMIAVGVFLGAVAALTAFRYLKRGPKVEEETKTAAPAEELLTLRQMLEKEGLIPAKMTDNKYCLHPEYLIELMNFIGVVALAKAKETGDKMRKLRRGFYSEKNWDLYEL